jgi:hypothetical protein
MLKPEHYQHLQDEGFTSDEIEELKSYGARSISLTESLKLGIKKWNGTRHVSDGGLYFPFHQEYGQVRLNTPVEAEGRKFKYLGPAKPAKCWYPQPKIHAITEGWKDAAMATVRGMPTGAIVGVDTIIYSMPQGCGIPIIFDSDGWRKPQVVRALVTGSLWMNGRINLFPEMPEHPTGGACEWFRSGGTLSQYQDLIDGAFKPVDFLSQWINYWINLDEVTRAECARVAAELTHILQNPDKYIRHLESRVQAKHDEWTHRTR